MTESNPPGRLAGRFLKTLAVARADQITAGEFISRAGWPGDEYIIKAAVGALSTGTASALLREVTNDFMAYVRARSIVGRIEGFRRLPFHTRAIQQTSGAAAHWVAESAPIPVGSAAFTRGSPLEPRKVAGISAQTIELAREAGSEATLLDDLAAACVEALDLAFIDPGNAGDLVTPASVTYGQPTVVSGVPYGARIAELVEALDGGGGDVGSAVWVMHSSLHARLILEKVADADGRLAGRPVVASKSVPTDTAGSVVALVDPTGIELAGGTEAELAVSHHGDLILDTDPESTSAPGPVSLWQTEAFAMRAVTRINWRATQGRVVYINSAQIGA